MKHVHLYHKNHEMLAKLLASCCLLFRNIQPFYQLLTCSTFSRFSTRFCCLQGCLFSSPGINSFTVGSYWFSTYVSEDDRGVAPGSVNCSVFNDRISSDIKKFYSPDNGYIRILVFCILANRLANYY